MAKKTKPKAQPPPQTKVEQALEDGRKHVESYWQTWNKPLAFRTLIPRLVRPLKSEEERKEFMDAVETGEIMRVIISPDNRKYVYPGTAYRPAVEQDDVIFMLLEADVEIVQAKLSAREEARKRRANREHNDG